VRWNLFSQKGRDEGEIPRARVQEITGKAATVSVEIIKLGLAEGYFETPSPKGPLRVAFPAKIHEFYFPQLFLDSPIMLESESRTGELFSSGLPHFCVANCCTSACNSFSRLSKASTLAAFAFKEAISWCCLRNSLRSIALTAS
jgi:hypothetical protein